MKAKNIDQEFMKIWDGYLNTFTRWIQIQLYHYQYVTKIIG